MSLINKLKKYKGEAVATEDTDHLFEGPRGFNVPKGCTLCSLGNGNAISPSGPRALHEARLLIIGEKPGRTENNTGEHFVGELSKIMRELVMEVLCLPTRTPQAHGFLDYNEVETVIYTNAVLCHTQDDIKPSHFKTCSYYGQHLIQSTNCPIILCGGKAITTYLPREVWPDKNKKEVSVKSVRGKLYYADKRYWLPTFNPAVITRGLSYVPEMKNGRVLAKKIIKPYFDSPLWHFIGDLRLLNPIL